MCQSPITIYNNSNYVNLHNFDYKRSVPCGKCVECQRNKQIEYAIRGYYEYKECIDDGGFAYWDTLTYNSSHLPHFEGFPCFCKEDVQKFMKRLRRRLEYIYCIPQDVLRYIVTCEYGEEHKRPHYHVIFFVHSDKIGPSQFHAALVNCWRNCKKRVIKMRKNGTYCKHRDGSPIYEYVRDIRGNTDLRHAKDPSLGVLTSNAAISYVTKYICKEDTYIMTLAANINDALVSAGKESISKDLFKKYFQPWHLQSVGFGSYLERCPEQLEFIKDLSCVVPVGIDGKRNIITKKYALPMYYLKRLYYEPVGLPDGRWMLIKTKEYCDILYRKEMERFEDFVNHTESQIKSIDHLYSLLDHEANQEPFSRLKLKVESFKQNNKGIRYSLSDNVSYCLGSWTVRDYCTFAKYFRFWFTSGNDLIADDVIYHRIYDLGDVENPLKTSKRIRRDFGNLVEWRNNGKFKPLLELYDLLSEMMLCFSQYNLDREEELREKKRELRAITIK